MIEHKIVHGLSTIYKKEASHADAMPSNGHEGGIMDFLVSTPAVLGMIIEASRDLLDPLLPDGFITVGKNISLSHERPTLIGETITLVITVTKVEGENVFLDVTGHDATGVVCKATYERCIVNKDHLIDVAYRRAQNTR